VFNTQKFNALRWNRCGLIAILVDLARPRIDRTMIGRYHYLAPRFWYERVKLRRFQRTPDNKRLPYGLQDFGYAWNLNNAEIHLLSTEILQQQF
jgi:hypothetical protein